MEEIRTKLVKRGWMKVRNNYMVSSWIIADVAFTLGGAARQEIVGIGQKARADSPEQYLTFSSWLSLGRPSSLREYFEGFVVLAFTNCSQIVPKLHPQWPSHVQLWSQFSSDALESLFHTKLEQTSGICRAHSWCREQIRASAGLGHIWNHTDSLILGDLQFRSVANWRCR